MFINCLVPPLLTFQIVGGYLLGVESWRGSTEAIATTNLGEILQSPIGIGKDTPTANSAVSLERSSSKSIFLAKPTPDQEAVITSSVSLAANQPPVISIISPANGTLISAGADLPVIVSASDPDGSIAKVQFFQGQKKLGEDLSSPYSFTWKNLSAGKYILKARAVDNRGAVTTSTPRILTVQKGLVP